VINYDLLVGDMSFYNQTLVFALSDNERHGTDMLQLIENLMAPWHNGNLADCDETVLVNERVLEPEILVYSVLAICKISCFMFFVTVVVMIMSLPFNIYLKIKSKSIVYSTYDESKSKTFATSSS